MRYSVFTLPMAVMFCAFALGAFAQSFSKVDTIRGSVTAERAWWDLNYYHLDLAIDPGDSSITGSNTIYFTALQPGSILQIDLQDPLLVDEVWSEDQMLKFDKRSPAHYIHLPRALKTGEKASIRIAYSGKPHIARRAPWDGGFSWSSDSQGNPFAATSCQGIGASIWWPCKDHMYDEPDSMRISLTVPKPLVAVANGRLQKEVHLPDGKTRYDWFVGNPINNYGVNANIANYTHFSEVYRGLKGPLDMNYYVLPENLEKAKLQFKQVALMMEAFEHWFGPYPFYSDGYQLVEVPYLGMEHQSSITYGNKYQNGYLGRDLSGTGWGMLFDFIIIHESGHEWFANNITYKDRADMWIHEGFTAYSECLYVEYFHGKEAGADYVIGTRTNIQNDRPIIAAYDVNAVGSGDMYSKGSNMLHTLRQVIRDDKLWRQILIGLNKEFYHKTVTTKEIEDYISKVAGINLNPFFDQYLRDSRIPILEYRIDDKNSLSYRWINTVSGFNIPVSIWIDGKENRITPQTRRWNSIQLDTRPKEIKLDRNYYIAGLDARGK